MAVAVSDPVAVADTALVAVVVVVVVVGIVLVAAALGPLGDPGKVAVPGVGTARAGASALFVSTMPSTLTTRTWTAFGGSSPTGRK